METNQALTFDQLPAAVTRLLCKIDNLERLLILNAVPQSHSDQWFTIEELSDYLPGKPAITTLYGKVQRREIPFSRKGKRLNFRKSEIDQWLVSGRVKTAAELTAQSDQFIQPKERLGGRKAS